MNSATRTLDELLQHERFVQRLARSLLGAEGDADDLVQETWLRAVQHPPDSRGQARRWLGTVVRNLARDRHDAERTRELREAAVAKAEATLPLQQLIEREETRKKIVQALGQLSPEHASAIVLRFFEGLPPREIARRLSVPVETIKKRLGRGVSQLREELDGLFEGGRAGWTAALPLLAGASGGSTATVATVSLPAMIGSLFASSTAKVLCALVVVAIGAMFVLRPRHSNDAPTGSPVLGGPQVAVVDPSGGSPMTPLAPRPLREDKDPSGAAARVVSGRVLDPAGMPINNADVRVVLRMPNDQPAYVPMASFDKSTRTVSNGRFVMAVAPFGKYLILGDAPGFALAAREWVNPGDDVDLIAALPGTISGRVLRRDTGEPVKGAAVLAYLPVLPDQPVRRATSDESGVYSLTGLPSGPVSLNTSIDGLVAQWDALTLEAGATKAHEVVLDRGGTVSGHVFDAESNRPIEGARVGFAERSLPTDAGGAFTLTGLEQREYSLTAWAKGWLPTSQGVVVDLQRTSEVVFSLAKGELASGLVLNAVSRQPIEGVSVDSGDAKTKTDKSGRFEVVGKSGDRLMLTFQRDGYSSRMMLWRLHEKFTGAQTIELAPADVRIAGHVRNEAGAPMADVRVECRLRAGGGDRFDEVIGTDANGAFEFLGCARDSAFEVIALTPGFSESFVEIGQDAKGAGTIEFVLHPSPIIEGTVADEAKHAVSGVKIVLSGSGVMHGIARGPSTTTDQNGRFRLASPFGTKDGKLSLTASAEGFAEEEIEIPATAGSHDLTIYRVGRIRGRLVDASTGEPIRGARIDLAPVGPDPEPAAWTRDARHSGKSDDTAEFEFEAPAGAHVLLPKASGYARLEPPLIVEVVSGKTLNVGTVRVPQAGRFEGTIRRASGEPAGVELFVRDSASGTNRVVARTDDSGWYRTEGIAPGTYEVFAVDPGTGGAMGDGAPSIAPCWPIGSIDVKQGSLATLDTRLPAPARLTVWLTGETERSGDETESTKWAAGCPPASGVPGLIISSVDGAPLTACGRPWSSLSSVVGVQARDLRAGEAISLNLPACSCKLVFKTPGFQTIEKTLALVAGNESRVDLELKRAPIPGAGK